MGVNLRRDGDLFVLDLGADENRIDRRFLETLGGALDEIEASDDVGALVTCAQGKFFCNGFDLEAMGKLERREVRQFLSDTQKLWARLLVFPLPTVAIVQGHAFGAGAVTAVAHDSRVMREDRGFFCLPEIDLGMRFRPGMMALLQAKWPPALAQEVLLSGRRYGGTEALERGLVDATANVDSLLETARRIAAPFLGKDRKALHSLKLSMYPQAHALLHADDPQP